MSEKEKEPSYLAAVSLGTVGAASITGVLGYTIYLALNQRVQPPQRLDYPDPDMISNDAWYRHAWNETYLFPLDRDDNIFVTWKDQLTITHDPTTLSSVLFEIIAHLVRKKRNIEIKENRGLVSHIKPKDMTNSAYFVGWQSDIGFFYVLRGFIYRPDAIRWKDTLTKMMDTFQQLCVQRVCIDQE